MKAILMAMQANKYKSHADNIARRDITKGALRHIIYGLLMGILIGYLMGGL